MIKQTATGILTGVAFLLLAGISPASADYNFEISGNGARSDNTIRFNSENTVSVSQQNNTRISNDVNVDLTTGDNNVSGNTGGDVSVNTGDATANITIKNNAGMNYAQVNSLPSDQNVQVKVDGNGYRSDNTVDLNLENTSTVRQNNNTNIDNNVDVSTNTGNNNVSVKDHHMPQKEWSPTYPMYQPKNHPDIMSSNHDKKYDHHVTDNKDYQPWMKKHLNYASYDYGKVYMPNKGQDHMTYAKSINDYDHGKLQNRYLKSDHNNCNQWYHPAYSPWNENVHGNTGGDVSIHTGDAAANVSITNQASSNFLYL